MKSRLLILMVCFLLVMNPASIRGQTSNPIASQGIRQFADFREVQSDKAYTDYQEWLELLKKATQHQMKLNIGARKLLDSWQAKSVSLTAQSRILVALRKELKQLLELWRKQATKALPSGQGSLSNILEAVSALETTIEIAKITSETNSEISAAILQKMDEFFDGPWYAKLARVKDQIDAAGIEEYKFIRCLDDSGCYYLAREFLKEERDALRAANAEDVVWVGGKMKSAALIPSGKPRVAPKRSIDLDKPWWEPRFRSKRDWHAFEQKIWGVPRLEVIWLSLQDHSGSSPKGKYRLEVWIPGMKDFFEYTPSDINGLYLPLWKKEYSYAVAGRTLHGTIKCEEVPATPEHLQLVISFGGQTGVISADPDPSLELTYKVGDYLVDTGLYLDRLCESRLKLLEDTIFDILPELIGSHKATVGQKGKLQVKVKNVGPCDIKNLWLGVDILDGNNRTVETTRTLRSSTETPGIMGNIYFGEQQGQGLRQGKSWTFSCDYSFDESSTGHKYAPGDYTVRYCVWIGPPGDGLQLMEPDTRTLTLKPGTESTAFPERPDIQIIGFSQDPDYVALDTEVQLIFTVQNQSDSPLKAGHLEWWVCNENGELMKKFERTAVTMAPKESRRFSEPIKLASKGSGGEFTAGTYKVLFSACMPSPDIPDAKLVVGNKSNLTFQVLASREQIAANIRGLIDTIEARETEALPRIREEERRRAEERRREEELELQIAEYYRKLNEEENVKVRRELEEARDRLTQALLALASEHQQRRNAAARIPPPVKPQAGQLPNTPRPYVPEPKVSDGPLTVKIWTVPKQLSISELWRTSRIDVTLFYAASKDCNIEVNSQLNAGYVYSDLKGKLLDSKEGFSIYEHGASWIRQPATSIIDRQVKGGNTYTYNIGPFVIPPKVYQFYRSLNLETPKFEKLRMKSDTTFTIKAKDGRRLVSDSITFRVVP